MCGDLRSAFCSAQGRPHNGVFPGFEHGGVQLRTPELGQSSAITSTQTEVKTAQSLYYSSLEETFKRTSLPFCEIG